MKDTINKLTVLVENLESEFEAFEKESNESSKLSKKQVLELLAKLKRAQDDPANEKYDEDYEDLIFKVIYIVGQLK